MKNYTIYLITHKKDCLEEKQRLLYPEEVHLFDGTDYPSFSKLVNDCIVSCPTEIVIMLSYKAYPTIDSLNKMLSLINDGYALVALYRFAFFGFKKELIRKIGFLDERYVGGGYEDIDFYIRLKEANLGVYITEEIKYDRKMMSSWNSTLSFRLFKKKWTMKTHKEKYIIRNFQEEKYSYDLGKKTNEHFLSWNERVINCKWKRLNNLNNFYTIINLHTCEIINHIKDIVNLSYLELGVRNNDNFNTIKCKEKFSVDINGKALFNGTTDDFFSQNKNKYDIIFIDANHDYEYVLNDFNNSLDVANKWIILHDMIPPSIEYTNRNRCSDSYKLLYRIMNETDMEVYSLDNNFGLTFVKMPGKKITYNDQQKISYQTFMKFIQTKKLYSNYEIIDILNME